MLRNTCLKTQVNDTFFCLFYFKKKKKKALTVLGGKKVVKNEFVLDVEIKIPAALSRGKYMSAITLNFTITVLKCIINPLLLVISTSRRDATPNQAFSLVHLASIQV